MTQTAVQGCLTEHFRSSEDSPCTAAVVAAGELGPVIHMDTGSTAAAVVVVAGAVGVEEEPAVVEATVVEPGHIDIRSCRGRGIAAVEAVEDCSHTAAVVVLAGWNIDFVGSVAADTDAVGYPEHGYVGHGPSGGLLRSHWYLKLRQTPNWRTDCTF